MRFFLLLTSAAQYKILTIREREMSINKGRRAKCCVVIEVLRFISRNVKLSLLAAEHFNEKWKFVGSFVFIARESNGVVRFEFAAWPRH